MTISPPPSDPVHRRADHIRSLLGAGKDAEARPLIEALCRDHPERPAGFVLQAQCAVRARDWEASLAWWEYCLARFPNPDFRWSIGKAEALMFLGRLTEAEAVFAEVRELHPDLPGPAAGLATCASRLNHWEEALERWSFCIEHFPDDVQLGWLVARAQALQALQRPDDALEAWREVLRRYPEDRFAQWNLDKLLGELDRSDQATTPPPADPVLRRAEHIRVLLEAGKDEEAYPLIEALCRDHPDRPAGFVLQAQWAIRKAAWELALDRWEYCLTNFPKPDFRWSMGKAETLMFLGRLAEAEEIYAEVHALHPDLPGPAAGLATCATRLNHWADALERWTYCIEHFPEHIRPGWLVSRAQALQALQRPEDALEAFRQILARHPEDRFAQWSFIRLLSELNRNDQALFEMDYGVLRGRKDPDLLVEKLRIWNSRTDTAAARECFAAAFEATETIDNLTGLFDAVPETFEGWQRVEAWLQIESRLAAFMKSHPGQKDWKASALAMRLLIAKRDYDGFLAAFDSATLLPEDWKWKFDRLAVLLRAERFPDLRASKVFVIGLAKTGTTSISAALEILGFLTAHYRSAFTNEIISDDDLFIFDALSDAPICRQFESLYYMFPKAKFIHTIRPFDDWSKSFQRHTARWHGTADFDVLERASAIRNSYLHGADFAKVGVPLYYKYTSPREAYDAYLSRVDAFFRDKPVSKLATFDVVSGTGWNELCEFLGCPVPDQPYPWKNRSR